MLRLLFVFFILNLIFSSFSNANILKEIDITGNQRISDETIKLLGKIELNKFYNDNELNTIFKDLYDTKFFKNLDINFIDGKLTLNVIENPVIELVNIEGFKNDNLKKTVIDNMSLKERKSFTEIDLNKDISLIKNILQINGFYFSKIVSSINLNQELNSVILKLNIDLGPRAKIKKISFIGDKKIKDSILRNIIISEEHKFWKFISNKKYLNQSNIGLDIRLLENFYKNLGFYKVEISNSFVEFDNEGNFNLIYNINAGSVYVFNDLKLNVPSDYNLSDFDEVIKIFEKIKGKKYSLDIFNLILEEIDKIASFKLYDFIDAQVDENILDNEKINFTFNVVDSEKFYVERINILGNYQTYEEVIRNKFIVDEGDPYNKLLFQKSLNDIRSLNIFKNVKYKEYDGSGNNLKVIDIEVEEKPTGEIFLAAGVGTSGGTIGGGIKEKNFLGKGINLLTNIEVSEESIKGQFIYSKPNFAYTDNTLFTSLKATTSDFMKDYGYKISSNSFSLGTKFEQYEKFFLSPEVALNFDDLKTNSSASTQLKKQEGSYKDLYFNYAIDYDLRNSTYRPSSGLNTSFYQELPLFSENNEISNTLILTQYKTLNQKNSMIGRGSLYIKSVNSLDDSDVRVSKRAKVPENRLRGFEYGKIGPVDGNDYIGGNYVSALNLSTNLPNLLPSVENLDFSYFIDFANVWGVDYNSSIDKSNGIRSSTGLSVDWLTPVGPLSFSFSKAILKESTDKTEGFRFNLGTTF
jgi:outer membrane protein insertion porin family